MTPGKGGPSTPDGKAAVSRNALTHGITSNATVIEGMESHADWLRHLDGIVAHFAPEGALERAFAERVAHLLWRLRRVARYEVAVATRQVDETEYNTALADAYLQGTLAKGELPEVDPQEVARLQPTRLIPTGDAFERILRYETHLHRQCLQTLHEIEALQARRRGEHSPLARVDVSGPPLN
jgi:hypothetical protein